MKKHWTIIFLILLLVSLSPSSIYANEILPSGINEADLAAIIDAYIAENDDTTAAVSIAVFRGDEILYKTHHGQMNIETGKMADLNSVYEWGSVTKLLVWVSVMQLWEKGDLDLNKNIQTYLPDDFFNKLNYDTPITMIHLMNHNAGFEDTVFQMSAQNENEVVSLEEALRRTEPHQVFPPGQVSAYSNWSTSLAAYIVERISGQSFSEYVHENIFQPLGMEHTAIEVDYRDNPGVKEELLANQGYLSDLTPMDDGLFFINLYPSGSASGTLDDFEIFAKALIPNHPNNKLLFENESTLEEMLAPTQMYPGTEIDYVNHGLWSHEFEVQALGHGGNTNMYSSYLLFDPLSELGMVVMTNQGGEIIYNHELPQLIFGERGAMAKQEGRTDLPRMADLYYGARTIRKGIASLYTISVLQPFFVTTEDRLSGNLFGLAETSAEEIAPNTLLITQSLGDMELTNLARYSEIDGVKKLSAPFGESLEADRRVWAITITTILFLIAVIWSILMIVASLIYWIIQKIRGKKNNFDALKNIEMATAITILLLLVNTIIVVQQMMNFNATLSTVTINVVLSIFLAVIPIIYALLLFKDWSTLRARWLQKTSYLLTLVLGLVVPLAVIVLEMYRL